MAAITSLITDVADDENTRKMTRGNYLWMFLWSWLNKHKNPKRHCKQYFTTLKTWFFFSTYDTKAYDELEHVHRTWLPIKNMVKSHLALFTYKTFTDSLERFRAPTYASFSCAFTKSTLKQPFPPREGIICGTAIFQITGRINQVNLPNYYFTAPRPISN